MIPKKNKLSSVEVKLVFNSPDKVFYSDFFKVLFVFKSNSKKFAVIVSKHITKKAVKRNTIKRKCFSMLSEIFKDTKDGFYVIIIKEPFLKTKRNKVLKNLKEILL